MTQLLKDILNEPGELQKSLAYTLGPGRAALERAARVLNEAEALYLTGIGSSWHAGLAVQSLLQAGGRLVSLLDASELLHFTRITPNAALVVLSRSGKSVEIVNLLPLARRAGARIVDITNTPDSPLGREADVTLPLEAAFDHNVSITMYSALALVGGLLASAALGDLDAALEQALSAALSALPPAIDRWSEQIAASGWLTAEAPTYFLARGGSLASCHEARLLWEEAAKAPASALTTGGFRHGPQEMLRPETRIGLWIDGDRLRSEDLALTADLRRLGARVMLIGQNLPANSADLVLSLPPVPALRQFLIDIIPAQLAAEQLARLRGEDCDSFRICPYIVEAEGGLTGAE
jgi:glucosamine--fructose-6-phosphate aminotransferase (isomerizing)